MIDLDLWKIRIALLVALWCAIVAGGLAYQNYTLTDANLALVRMLDEQLSEAEARIGLLERVQSDVMAAVLTSGSVAADSVLRDKK